MKRFVIISLFLISTICSHAQKISLDNLVELHQKNDASELNDVMLNLGWKLHDTDRLNFETATLTWHFIDEYGSIKAVLHIYYDDYGTGKITDPRPVYITKNISHYNEVRDKVKSYGMKKVGSYIYDNTIATAYEGKNYVVVLKVISSESTNSGTEFHTNLFTKEEFYRLRKTQYEGFVTQGN